MHAARHPAETEALAIVGSAGAWRPPVHPRYAGRLPVLDWQACRAAATGAVPWLMLRTILGEVEAGAREGANDIAEPGDIE